jgi:hypothetical protein
MLSSTSGTLRTNSRSPPLSLSPIRNVTIGGPIGDHSDNINQCDGICNSYPISKTNTVQRGILRHNKIPNLQMPSSIVNCSQV